MRPRRALPIVVVVLCAMLVAMSAASLRANEQPAPSPSDLVPVVDTAPQPTEPPPAATLIAAGANATGYFKYFGAAAGDPKKGYYSYDLGTWHIVVLNGECGAIGGCGPSSTEAIWLHMDLAASTATCTLAVWHEPRWSSGVEHGSDPRYGTFWNELYAAGAEIVLNGHDHDYERFAPQNPDGQRDDVQGMREFVVGTGGRSLYPVKPPIVNSEVLRNDSFGVLVLTLGVDRYDWRFVPVEGSSFTDSGTGTCH